MKKILFICLMAFMFCGCVEVHDETPNHKVAEFPAKYIGRASIPSGSYKFYIIEIDGDEYLLMDGPECGGICAYEAHRKKKGI